MSKSVILFVRWRDYTSEGLSHWRYGRWCGEFGRDNSVTIYAVEHKNDLPNVKAPSHATRALRPERVQVQVFGPRRGTCWVPFGPEHHVDLLTRSVA